MLLTWKGRKKDISVQISATMFAIVSITCSIFYAYAMIEVLSLFHALTSFSVSVSWIILAVIIGFIVFKKQVRINRVHNLQKNGLLLGVLFITIIFIVIISLCTVPYNYDSMTYHLSRVMNWKQNQSVDYYATNIPRQLFNSPLAEYLILQLELLIGIENIFNLVQTSAYVISIGTLYGIGRKIGLEKKVCYFTCILFMMTPIVMVEATTTQNDLLACMWSLFGVYILIDYLTADRLDVSKYWVLKTILLATVFVMCYLTKGTACISLLPFVLVMGIVRIIKKDKFAHLAGHLLVGVGQIIIALLPSFFRNFQLYGSFLGLGNYSNTIIDTYSPKYILINNLKNVATHLAFNEITWLNPFIEEGVVNAASTVGIDVNDPLITWMGEPFLVAPSYSCDSAKIPLLIILSLLSIGVFIWARKHLNVIQRVFYITSLGTWIMTFSLIKWQPWITRLTICVMAFMCISIGIALNALMEKNKKMSKMPYALIIICVIFAVPVAHSLLQISRVTMHNDDWFYSRLGNRRSYTQTADVIKDKGYESIGLKTGVNSYEYPLWRLLERSNVSVIKHILLEDESVRALEDTSFTPDCILVIDVAEYDAYSTLEWSGYRYGCVASFDNVLLFEKDYQRNFEEYLPGDADAFVEGFAVAEGDHIWMIDDKSVLRLKCSDLSDKNISVRIRYSIFGDMQRLRIIAGEYIVFDGCIEHENQGYIDLDIPQDAFEGEMLNLTFEHPDAISPYETDGTLDMRRLSFDITKVNIIYK